MSSGAGITKGPVPGGVAAKLSWAERHIDHVELLIAEWTRSNVDRVEPRRDGSHLVYYLVRPVMLPTELPLVIGDALFNLRATLDNLIFGLHLEHTPGFATDPDAQRDSQWPVVTRPVGTGWSNGNKAKIKGLPSSHKAAIRDLQPHTGDAGELRFPDLTRLPAGVATDRARREAYERLATASDIGLLDLLHASDKHRQLHPIITEAQFLVYDARRLTYLLQHPFVFEEKKELELSPPMPADLFQPNATMRTLLTLPVSLAGSSGYYSMPSELRRFAAQVRNVIRVFYLLPD